MVYYIESVSSGRSHFHPRHVCSLILELNMDIHMYIDMGMDRRSSKSTMVGWTDVQMNLDMDMAKRSDEHGQRHGHGQKVRRTDVHEIGHGQTIR